MAMSREQRRVLQKNTVELITDLEPLQILGYLYQEEAILQDDIERVRSQGTRKLQAEELLSILPRRGAKAFDIFHDALMQNEGQKHLAALLKEDDKNLKVDGEGTVFPDIPSKRIVVVPKVFPHQGTDDHYKMQSNPRGLCLIVDNFLFQPDTYLKNRNGSEIDTLKLQKLFLSLHYTVTVIRNQTAPMLRNYIRKFAKKPEHNNYDSVAVCLSSHGELGKIYTIDGELIPITELTSLFNGENATSLIGKPKLFFIQACRGGREDPGVAKDSVDGGGEVTIESEMFPEPDSYDEVDAGQCFVPAEADFLLAYSTVPGFVSHRNTENGTWFVQALCEIFTQFANKEDLVSMLVRVNAKVARDFKSHKQKKQIPSPVVRLTKKLYFNPLL